MNTVRFAILGSGSIARQHANAIAAAPSAELVGVWNRSREGAVAMGEEFGVPGTADLQEILSRADVDAVTVATPSGAHLDVIEPAAAAGKHVLCEKPLEVTTDRVRKVIEVCRKHDVLLAGVFQSRLSRNAHRIREAMQSGRFGRLVLASMQLRWYRDQAYYDSSDWRGTWSLDGGGALMNQGIHFVDLLCYLVGDPDEVQAYAATRAHASIEVEDTIAATLHFPGGGLGTIEASTACAPGFPRRLEISGEHGTALLEDDRLICWKFADEQPEDEQIRAEGLAGDQMKGGTSDPTAIDCEGHRRLIEDLACAIREKREPIIPGEEAQRAVRVIEAIYQAVRERRSVQVAK
ncbi:Gfo/Idh/MocA family protein [Phycisphaerales bacterium AB-hyl4]|uniref:Gfo/Idh/MocA family protein n=1 Tax=Natronomicrosphaera hydrolytica TaxID=3242702 RepID=A0ABV4U346_9BACT